MNENKFDGMGRIYSQFRPSYPKVFMDYLYSEVGMAADSVIADVGSGTGIFTKQLLEQGNKVYAVEPNRDMRAVAERDLKGYPYFVSVNGTAENTGLANGSVDFVTAAQAFHWFDRQRFKAECRRILKPGGKVILVWNSRDESDALVMENDAVNTKFCPAFKGFSGGMRGAENENDFDDFFCGKYDSKIFKNDLSFDEQGFVGRNLSASYSLKEKDELYSDYTAALRVVFAKYNKDGALTMPNFTRSYVGRV